MDYTFKLQVQKVKLPNLDECSYQLQNEITYINRVQLYPEILSRNARDAQMLVRKALWAFVYKTINLSAPGAVSWVALPQSTWW